MTQISDQGLLNYIQLIRNNAKSELIQYMRSISENISYDDSLSSLKSRLNELSQPEDGDVVGQFFIYLADVLYQQNHYDRAKVVYLIGLKSLSDNLINIARLQYGLGNTYYMTGEYFKARDYYLESLSNFETQQNQVGQTEVHVQLSNLFRSLGEFAKSNEHVRSALSISIDLDRESSGLRSIESLCNLATQLHAMQQLNEARSLLDFASDKLKDKSWKKASKLLDNTIQTISNT